MHGIARDCTGLHVMPPASARQGPEVGPRGRKWDHGAGCGTAGPEAGAAHLAEIFGRLTEGFLGARQLAFQRLQPGLGLGFRV